MGHQEFGRLTADDAAVALRSFCRRFREAVRPDDVDGSGIDAAATPPGTDRSPLEVVAGTTGLLRRRTRAVERILAEPPGRLDADDLPGGAPPTGFDRPRSLPEALDDLDVALETLAGIAVRTPLPRWERTVEAGGVTVRADELLRDAVSIGRQGVDAFVAALRAARAAAS